MARAAACESARTRICWCDPLVSRIVATNVVTHFLLVVSEYEDYKLGFDQHQYDTA
jgi:hypothetical protein